MASGPLVSSETRERQTVACNALASDVDKALADFLAMLQIISDTHDQSVHFQRHVVPASCIEPQSSDVAYMKTLASIGCFKKATKGTPTLYTAFCGKKLEEVNKGIFSITIP
jgi:hypothetical protein